MPEATEAACALWDDPAEPLPSVFRQRTEAEAYVASVCFKHGPPRLLGVELEWTVHHADNPARPLEPAHLADALAPHTPQLLRSASPAHPLPSGASLTVEPGGQVEISSLPHHSLAALRTAVTADIDYLAELLGRAGLALGSHGTDPHRTPRRLLRTPRYDAMERAFEPIGEHGITMMCSTAAIQVCLDVGERWQAAQRWSAIHALGPVLVAAFANSPVLGGKDTGWASSRLRSVLGTDEVRTVPGPTGVDPAEGWARRALDTPLLCLRRADGSWDAPPGMSFADWIDGALPLPPTASDLDYHLSTLFPPVRPHGYYEVRYLDAQPLHSWFAPVALLTALLDADDTTSAALDACAPVADKWLRAARHGLADTELARAAKRVFELGCQALENTDLDAQTIAELADGLDRRLHDN
ncbi:MAG: ergothioneine biosynthesis glutamate--cysteine ligase EgtA [Pseudonocardiaceae bacterium]|nr:ergothioneine biosynthesis glutamate--cysteine ligase EgtA [Pseudonocardiaceae bacterium]